MKIALLNTSILTSDGTYHMTTITLDEVKELIEGRELDSAIGHESTAQIMTELLGRDIPMNRQMFVQQIDQSAIVFKLHGRAAEGAILSREDIERIGYSFKLLTRDA